MAKQIDTQLEGTFGSIIYYKWKDVYCLRTKGRTGKQAKIAKDQSNILGQASALSARLRKAFKPMLPGPVNREMMYRFNYALQQWLRTGQQSRPEPINEIPFLNGFSFSPADANNHFHAALPVSREATGNLLLHLPAFDSPNPIHPLPFNGRIVLHIVAASCKQDDASDSRVYETEQEILYTGSPLPARELMIPLQTMPGCITVVALSVNGVSKGIVWAMYN